MVDPPEHSKLNTTNNSTICEGTENRATHPAQAREEELEPEPDRVAGQGRLWPPEQRGEAEGLRWLGGGRRSLDADAVGVLRAWSEGLGGRPSLITPGALTATMRTGTCPRIGGALDWVGDLFSASLGRALSGRIGRERRGWGQAAPARPCF
jgi:hypothetical protein